MKTKINLNTYLSLGGKIENLNFDKTFTTYYDRNIGQSISSISVGSKTNPSFGNPNGVQLYSVEYTNGSSHNYADMWIETEVELTLTSNYKK